MRNGNLIGLDISELNEVAGGAGASLDNIHKLVGAVGKDIGVNVAPVLELTPKILFLIH